MKSSGGFVITYRLEEASHDELVSRNLEDSNIYQQIGYNARKSTKTRAVTMYTPSI